MRKEGYLFLDPAPDNFRSVARLTLTYCAHRYDRYALQIILMEDVIYAPLTSW